MANGDVLSTSTSYSMTVNGDTDLYARFAPVQTEQISGSETFIPNGYTNTGSYNFTLSTNASRQISNAYNNADNTSSSARLTLASSSSSTRTSTMYLEFDKSGINDIPSNAAINSITANVRYYVNNTTYVSAVSIQLHSNTTAKGTAVTTRPTSSTKYAITPGTWTLAELQNIRLYISATHNRSTSNAYLYLYGADVTINYRVSNTYHELKVNSRSEVYGVTITPETTQTVRDGESLTFALNSNSGVLRDNGTICSLTEITDGDYIPSANTNSNFTLTDIENAYAGSDSTNYAQLQLAAGRTGTIYLEDFGIDLPSSVTIRSVDVQATLQYNRNSSTSGFTASCRMYSGSTAMGSSTSIVSSGSSDVAKTTFTLTPGTWTASQLSNARLYITATNSASSTARYLYVYGVTVTVALQNAIYTYTLSNIGSDHSVIVKSS